jgi:hypothetical protein
VSLQEVLIGIDRLPEFAGLMIFHGLLEEVGIGGLGAGYECARDTESYYTDHATADNSTTISVCRNAKGVAQRPPQVRM